MDITLKKIYGEEKKAKVGKVLVVEGDIIAKGDKLFNVETAKGNAVVKAENEGSILEILIEEGQEIKLGDLIFKMEVNENISNNDKAKTSYSFGLAKPKKESIESDITIIGAGPGGYVAAIRAAQLNAKVTLIERDKLGGTCLNTGCIPTKSFVKSTHLIDEVKASAKMGIKIDSYQVDLKRIVGRKDEVVNNLQNGIKHLLEHWNIRYVEGNAIIKDDTIIVNNEKIDLTISSKKIILATGSSPMKLNIPGADLDFVLTNEEILSIPEIPKSLTIIGGGVIGMEFAFIFNSLGTQVSVVEFAPNILNNVDEEIIEIILDECDKRGILVYTKAEAKSIALSKDQSTITTFIKDNQEEYIVSEKVLMSVGRKANLDTIDLKALNIELNERNNGIKVDETMLTSNPNIYAIGDITNILQLAHVASHQGIIAVENALGLSSKMDYTAIPSAVFVAPEFAVVGVSEKEAIEKKLNYKISKFPFVANGKALSQGSSEGFVKIIFNQDENTIIGASIIGPNATDLIANMTYLIQKKVDYKDLKHLVFAHPTTAESIHEAVLGLDGEAIHFV